MKPFITLFAFILLGSLSLQDKITRLLSPKQKLRLKFLNKKKAPHPLPLVPIMKKQPIRLKL